MAELVKMYPAQANSPETSLSGALTAAGTTVSVMDGSVLPDAPNLLTIGAGGNTAETVLMTAKDGNTLTVAEFSENYNHLLEYAELDTLPSLTKDGKWKEGEDDLSFLIFLPNVVRSEPVIQEENGKLSSFSYTLTDTEGDLLSPLEQNPLLAMALLRTQIDFLHPDLERISGQLLSSDDTQEPQRISSVLNYMDRHPYCSYTIETGNLRIIQEITLVGYNVDKHNSYSIGPDEDAKETYYSLTFTLEQH